MKKSTANRPEHAFAPFVRILGKGKTGTRSLTLSEAEEAFGMILSGQAEPVQVGAFLKLLRVKEETGEELVIDNKYVMSPKDLCTVQYLDRIADAGISVLKLEGRARAADYVATVTRVYREALDALADGTYDPSACEDRIAELSKVFNRGFWHGGYYCGEKMGEWAADAHSQATETRDQIGTVSNFFGKPGVVEFKLIKGHSSNRKCLISLPND